MRHIAIAFLAAIAGVFVLVPARADERAFVVNTRIQREVTVVVPVIDPATGIAMMVAEKRIVKQERAVKFEPTKIVVVVCDMWDDHWCKNAAKRCGELAKKTEPVLKACRDKGMTIVHCPSDCMAFYKDHPARKRALAVKKADPPKSKELPNPPLPVDDSDGGCDDEKPAKQFKAWTRQHAAITIDQEKDYITDTGNEVYNIIKEKGATTVFVLGVHTNMCVLNRSFAIKQMVKWGISTYLVRDLTDAMYNPKMKPLVTHDKGTQLIIEHIEQHWCPTIESKSLK
ncbi:MAG: isochorismatase family protein [Planctomycetia bacterium]|nr:isochorismatase family protein [Planctomycetia bacterium]